MKPAALHSLRYLALWLPYLPIERIEREERGRQAEGTRETARLGSIYPSYNSRIGRSHDSGGEPVGPDTRPFILVGREGNALRLVAACATARRLGLLPGLSFADARARVRELRVEEHDPEADRDLMERIAGWCDRYTPALALDPPDGLILEIAGSAHLFGGEEALTQDLRARLVGQGFTAKLAVASTPQAARALCRFGRGGVFTEEAQKNALLPLPVEALEAAEAVTVALRRAGLQKLGDLADRPRRPLASRFSDTLPLKLAQVLGEVARPIVPRRPVPDFHVEMRFAEPLGLRGDIDAALNVLVHRLCADLERAGQGGRHFELVAFRADGVVRRLDILSGRPLRVPHTLLRLISMRIEALSDPLDPGFGFDMMRLSVVAGGEAAQLQQGLDGSARADAGLAELVDRLSARFGEEAVRRPQALNSHLPERAETSVPAIAGQEAGGVCAPETARLPRPLYLFPHPQPVEAVVAEVPDGPPRRFRWRGAVHEIAYAEGPERIAAEWWRDTANPLTRDYFRVEDQAGHRFWLFRYGLYGREEETPRWFVHGLFP